MELSAIGRAVLIAREGQRLHAYRDSVGIWTIGVGHTSAAGAPAVLPGMSIGADECAAIFSRDIARYAQTVAKAVPEALPEHAFDALVSLCFNIGPGAFLRSSVLRRLKAGDRDGAADAILMWNRPASLIPRRQAEHDQFRTPYSQALPCARRGDRQPAAGAVSTERASSRPSLRRTIPRQPSVVPAVRPAPAPHTGTSLVSRLLGWLRGGGAPRA